MPSAPYNRATLDARFLCGSWVPCLFFFYRTSICQTPEPPLSKVYKRFGFRLNLKNWLRHFTHPSSNFTEMKSAIFDLDFRPQSLLSRLRFDRATHLKCKTNSQSADDCLVHSKNGSTNPPTLLWNWAEPKR